MIEKNFPGRLAVQQRVLPIYRAPFFDLLAQSCSGGLDVLAGEPRINEHISTADNLKHARLIKAKNLHFLHVQSPFYLCWQKGLISWLEKCQPDVLILEANPRYIRTRQAIDWMHKHGKPVLGWGLGAPASYGRLARQRQQARQKFVQRFDGMIAYSQRGADEYAALGIPVEKIFIAKNAVSPRPAHTFIERPPIFTTRPIVLFVGRLQARKRVDNLIHACAALPSELQPRLIVIGDGPVRSELENLAKEVYPQTEFQGALHGNNLDEYFRAADLFVLPGTGGLAVQQAMSFGLPVVVAQGDGTQDDLVTAKNGWTIPADNLAALERSLHEALGNVPALRKKGAESYRIVSDEVNLELMVAVFLKAANTILNN